MYFCTDFLLETVGILFNAGVESFRYVRLVVEIKQDRAGGVEMKHTWI